MIILIEAINLLNQRKLLSEHRFPDGYELDVSLTIWALEVLERLHRKNPANTAYQLESVEIIERWDG